MEEHEYKWIDELVHCTEPKRIIELVRLLVPEANDRTAELYARWTEYKPDDFVDNVMDNPSTFGRMKLIAKRFPYLDRNDLVKIFQQLPYIPLTEEQRLYRRRQLRDDAPEPPENKYLAGEKFSNEEWLTMPPELKYAIRAMRNNPDLDPKSAARLVVETMKKPPVDFSEDADEAPVKEKLTRKSPVDYITFYFPFKTNYLERMKILLMLKGDDEKWALEEAYGTLFYDICLIADPNFEIKELILVDANIASFHEAEKNS